MDIKIKIVPNPLYGRPGSLVESPYIAQVVHTGTVTAADICEACKQENPQMTEPLASLATETIMDYGSDKVVTDVVRFNLGSPYFTMEPAVSGSVPTVDASLSDANERYIKVVNGQSLNARIAALKPVITGEDLGDVMFRSTETTHDGEDRKNVIFGSEEFVALGKRLGGEGQRMELVDATGTVRGEATFVSGDALGQRFTYKLANPPTEDFDGKLILTSTGKDTPDASPKTIKVSVKFVAAGPVPIATNSDGTVKCMSVEDPESPDLPDLDGDWTIGFEGLADNAKWRYDSTTFKVDGETKDCRASCDGDTVTFHGTEGVGPTGEYDGVITVTLVDKDDEETTDTVDIPVHFHAEEH